MPSTTVSAGPSRRFYLTFVSLLLVWVALLMVVATTVIPDGYWWTYYSVDYSRGFIRRGLAGEILHLFDDGDYFAALRAVRWIPTVFFTVGLALVTWAVALRGGSTQRKFLLALLIPVLPFGFAFGVFSARTDLLGATALIAFAVSLTLATTRRTTYIVSAVYGVALAVLTLIHEATPFLFGLGTIAALTVLARGLSTGSFRISTALAMGPGIGTALAVVVFGKRGISGELCQLVPHGPVDHPMAAKPTPEQLLNGFHNYIDYHDWVCRAILPLFDQSFGDALSFVTGIGVLALAASTLYGIGVFAVSMYVIAQVSGVPVQRFRDALLTQRLAVLAGFVLILPIFLTGVDWIRWWVIIAFDLGIVYLLYATRQPEIEEPPTARSVKVLVVAAALLALIPIGIIPVFGAPVPM